VSGALFGGVIGALIGGLVSSVVAVVGVGVEQASRSGLLNRDGSSDPLAKS
jgi:hypothetical protein